jgi:lysophospholipase L1-like esterase
MDAVRDTAGTWVAGWGTAQQLARAAEPGGGPEMPDDAPADGELDDAPAAADTGEAAGAPTEVGAATVRMVARITVGGSAVRVALSNSFGLPPVHIGAARIAFPGGGGSRLTFAGRASVVLPTGALIYSDPVAYAVDAQTDLTVSLHVPGHRVTPTAHEVGLRTAWLAPGDQTAAADLRAATAFRSYLWLTGVDVLALPGAAAVVALGDSVVDGMGTTPGADAAWPSRLARRLADGPGRPPRAVVNMGIAGNRVLRETDGLGASALARFDRDVLGRPGVRWVVLSAGLNDLLFGLLPGMPPDERAGADDLVAGYRLLIGGAHRHGLRIVGCTLMAVGGAAVFSAELERTRTEVNRWIRDSGEFDAVVDLDAALRDPADPARVRAELLSGDGVHPNDAGHEVIASAFGPELFRR